MELLEINDDNVALVEGILSQIVGPDLQQTASYLQRMSSKSASQVQTSLLRHKVRSPFAADG
jgi:hypothetical protein